MRGNTIIPRTFYGSFYVVCAILRQLHLTLSMIFNDKEKFDVIFVDQLSANIPLLKLTGAKVKYWLQLIYTYYTLFILILCNRKILFYCHFPDKLLTQRETTMKSLYRIPIDIIEELTTGNRFICIISTISPFFSKKNLDHLFFSRYGELFGCK